MLVGLHQALLPVKTEVEVNMILLALFMVFFHQMGAVQQTCYNQATIV